MKKKEKDIATGLDRAFKKKVAEAIKLLEKYYAKPDSRHYYGYMLQRFLEFGGNYTVRYAIADAWHILKALKEHYKKNKAFAYSLDRIVGDGHDAGGIINAGERLETMFKFFDGFYHDEFSNLIELWRLQVYPETFTTAELNLLIDDAYSQLNG